MPPLDGLKAKSPKRAKVKARPKPKRSAIRLGEVRPSDMPFLEAFGEGGMKFALVKGTIKTIGAGYSKIKRYKKQRVKAQRFINQTNALMQKFPRLRRSWTAWELQTYEQR